MYIDPWLVGPPQSLLKSATQKTMPSLKYILTYIRSLVCISMMNIHVIIGLSLIYEVKLSIACDILCKCGSCFKESAILWVANNNIKKNVFKWNLLGKEFVSLQIIIV